MRLELIEKSDAVMLDGRGLEAWRGCAWSSSWSWSHADADEDDSKRHQRLVPIWFFFIYVWATPWLTSWHNHDNISDNDFDDTGYKAKADDHITTWSVVAWPVPRSATPSCMSRKTSMIRHSSDCWLFADCSFITPMLIGLGHLSLSFAHPDQASLLIRQHLTSQYDLSSNICRLVS